MVRGMKYAEIGLKNAGVEHIAIMTDSGKMMKMLNDGFVDFAISSRFNGKLQLKKLGLDSIHPLSPHLVEMKLYHYVHVKHQSLIPQLDAVIQSHATNRRIEKA